MILSEDENGHMMLPNRCDPTSIAQYALLGNKKRTGDPGRWRITAVNARVSEKP